MHRTTRRSLFGACTAGLILAAPCEAVFIGLRIVPFNCSTGCADGYATFRIYATFDDPGDRLRSVFGNANSPMTVICQGGCTFYQHPIASGHTAPNDALFPFFPELEWDTFVTIGLAVNHKGADQTLLTPSFGPLPYQNNTNIGWFVNDLGLPQGAPDIGGAVLIMQLTVPDGRFPSCNVGIQYRPAGAVANVEVNNCGLPLGGPLPQMGDIDVDLVVDINDLLLVLSTWGGTEQPLADPNDDGVTDIDDLLLVLAHWD